MGKPCRARAWQGEDDERPEHVILIVNSGRSKGIIMPSVSVPLGAGILGAGAISGASSLAGGIISGNAAKDAARQQSQSALLAAQVQQKAFEQTSANLQPYTTAGQQNLPQYVDFWKQTQPYLQPAVDEAKAAIPGAMTEATIKQTPGYQFVYDQTMKAINNSQAAKGLGASGSALKQGSTWASGLADQTYTNQFNMQQQRFLDLVQNLQNRLAVNSQTFNQLGAPVGLGAQVGSALGGLSQNVYSNIGNAGMASGQALAAGTAAQGNALGGAVNNLGQTAGNTLTGLAYSPYITNALMQPYNPYLLLSRLYGGYGGGGYNPDTFLKGAAVPGGYTLA